MNLGNSYEVEAAQLTLGFGGRVLGNKAAMRSGVLAHDTMWLRVTISEIESKEGDRL